MSNIRRGSRFVSLAILALGKAEVEKCTISVSFIRELNMGLYENKYIRRKSP